MDNVSSPCHKSTMCHARQNPLVYPRFRPKSTYTLHLFMYTCRLKDHPRLFMSTSPAAYFIIVLRVCLRFVSLYCEHKSNKRVDSPCIRYICGLFVILAIVRFCCKGIKTKKITMGYALTQTSEIFLFAVCWQNEAIVKKHEQSAS